MDIVRVCNPLGSLPSHLLPLAQTNRYGTLKCCSVGQMEIWGEVKIPTEVIVRNRVYCKQEAKKDKGEKSNTGQKDVERRQDKNLQESQLC